MDEMNTTMALLRAVLELIAKCETLEELRESAPLHDSRVRRKNQGGKEIEAK